MKQKQKPSQKVWKNVFPFDNLSRSFCPTNLSFRDLMKEEVSAEGKSSIYFQLKQEVGEEGRGELNEPRRAAREMNYNVLPQ